VGAAWKPLAARDREVMRKTGLQHTGPRGVGCGDNCGSPTLQADRQAKQCGLLVLYPLPPFKTWKRWSAPFCSPFLDQRQRGSSHLLPAIRAGQGACSQGVIRVLASSLQPFRTGKGAWAQGVGAARPGQPPRGPVARLGSYNSCRL
jgi:hypothetical protein